MLTVWSVCWGDKYSDYCVQRLQRSVRQYLSIEHDFICITDRDIEGVNCQPPINDLPGWWGKVNLFSFDVCRSHNIYLDLDVVLVSDITEMAMRYQNSSLATPLNWAQSGHGGCQSSVMIWARNYNAKQIYDLFDPAIAHWPPINQPGVLWGDQEWITELKNNHKIQVSPIEEGIKSYKYHIRGKNNKDKIIRENSIIIFHGSPKPEDCTDKETWFEW